MTLNPGSHLGPSEIIGSLGEGGMGAVYRARDTQLNRDVALKVLLPAVADDPDRLARFKREAQVLASLNHPNIAGIYGLEGHAIVMELVEGPTLADRLALGAIPVDEVIAAGTQIAEALTAGRPTVSPRRGAKSHGRSGADHRRVELDVGNPLVRGARHGGRTCPSPPPKAHDAGPRRQCGNGFVERRRATVYNCERAECRMVN